MSSPTANEAAVREPVRSIIAPMPIDKIVGQPSNSTVNVLKQQLAKIAAAVKTTSWGGRHGHLALALNDAEYQTVTNVPTLTTTRLVRPPVVPANLANNTTLTHRTRIMADHNLECQEFWKQESVDAIIVDKIVREAADAAHVRRTRRRLHRLRAQTIKTILEHLRTEWCVVTTLEKKQASAAFHFARELDKQQKLCRDIGTPAPDATKVQYYVEGMYSSDMFDDKEMQAWELKPSADKTWDSAKTHFVTLYKSKEKFNAERIARTGGYDSSNIFINTGSIGSTSLGTLSSNNHQTILEYTNSLETALEHTQEHAAALTTTQDHRLKQLETQQQELLSQTTKFMALLTAQQSIPTPGTTTGGQQRTARRNTRSTTAKSPRYCNSCKKSNVYHEDNACFALEKNKDKRPQWYLAKMFETLNYWNPLAASSHDTRRVRFTLPPHHRTTNSKQWRLACTNKPTHTIHPLKLTDTINIHSTATHMSPRTIKEGINNGSIPSAVSDTGATSTAGTLHDPFIHSKTRSTKIFMLPTGTTTAATIQAQLLLNVRPPANTVDIVPNLHQTLLSGSKFADANYTAVYDKHEVNFYDSANINITERAVLTGYRCPRTGLWRIPLRPITVNENTDTLILDSKCGLQSTQPRYHVPTPTHIQEHLQASLQCNTDHILNVYELPSIEQSIQYLHAAAGFPTKSTWLAAIRKGNYSTWPLITVKNVHKHFPQSEETQQGHMRNQRQGTRSTKQALPQAEPHTPLPQLHDIFIRTYDTHSTLYTDQTGKFPHLSSQGNRYQMILYHVDSNSIWAEPTKNKAEGELILARNRALQRMKDCGIQPTREVLDNEISAAYKLAIAASGMTYQLVPPDDHRHNIAEKAIQTWKDHFIAAISGTDAKFPSTFGANYYHKWNANSVFYGNPMLTPTFPPIRISTAIMTTMHTLSSPSAWKPLSTTNPTAANFLHNTAPKGMSSAHPTSTTAAGKYGHQLHAPPYITNPSVTPADAIIAAAANLSHLLTNNLQAHHNNKTKTPLPRVSAPPTSPAYNTRSCAHTITHETILHLLHNTQTPLTPRNAATRQFPRDALSAILDTDTGELLEYRHLIKNPKYCTIWKNAYGKELGRLAQGIPGTAKGTNTIVFLAYNEIPPQRRKDVTYGRIVANYRAEKEDPYRIRLTVGSNRITYPGDCGTPTADMLTTKILLNSVISTKGARFMTIDIKGFYLNTPMVRPEYMRLKLSSIPDHIIKLYKLDKLVTTDGYVYVLIQKGMYGLPQAGIIAQQLLEKSWPSKATGKVPSHLVSGNTTGAPSPSLCVLTTSVSNMLASNMHITFYKLSTNTTKRHKTGRQYLGLTIAWDYTLQQVQLSMPGYCKKAGHRFHHPVPIKPQHQPYPHTPRTYRAKQQFVDTADDSALLSNTDKTFIQEVIGVFLYYARAVDCTMLPALGSLATQQSAPTQNTMSKVHQFLDYAMTHPDAMITYRASTMILAVHSDASYLSETKARSRAGGHFFLSEDDPSPRSNGTILTLAQIIKPVMSSAAEAELGALYINAWETIPQRHLLNELGHPQPPTPIQIDNSTAFGMVTNIIQPKRTKAMDMHFHWLRCRENQKQFRTYWRAGTTNLADYVTKHLPPSIIKLFATYTSRHLQNFSTYDTRHTTY
eukprot:CCRYP_019933-RA/>CCRYP_019933-RA protein AED:0.03 eAED:0.04 QI:0/0/0/1/0.4/0.16/6/0/1642